MTAQNKGFTLIELLVVITIIAVLSAIGMTVYSSVQKSGRIAKRVEDLSAIKTALELYYLRNGAYPVASSWRSECTSWGGLASDQVIPGLVPEYMVVFPKDPQMNTAASTSCYLYTSSGTNTDYKLLDHNITEFSSADYQSQRNLVDPVRSTWSWAVWSSSASISW